MSSLGFNLPDDYCPILALGNMTNISNAYSYANTGSLIAADTLGCTITDLSQNKYSVGTRVRGEFPVLVEGQKLDPTERWYLIPNRVNYHSSIRSMLEVTPPDVNWDAYNLPFKQHVNKKPMNNFSKQLLTDDVKTLIEAGYLADNASGLTQKGMEALIFSLFNAHKKDLVASAQAELDEKKAKKV